MEIISKRKNKQEHKENSYVKEAQTLGSKKTIPILEENIAIRIDAMLYNTLTNYIEAAHVTMDYTYQSVSDLIRAALSAFKEGMELTEVNKKPDGVKAISTTIRVDTVLKNFWQTLPNRNRKKILERAIRTFIRRDN